MTHHRIVIVGAGFSGLGMAIKLRQEGEFDFALLERASDIGGTWRDNTYPGCRCDVPSHLYSFSFAPNPNWSSTFSPQPEILEYLRDCAHRYGVMPHIRFDTDLLAANWDEDARLWRLETTQGELTADVVIAAQGPLSDPSFPDLPGLESFEGTTFHSARWDHEHELAGERVAVIGTGASAIQFVPEIQPKVEQLHVFQRTAPWVVPHPNRPMSAGSGRSTASSRPRSSPCAPGSTGRARRSCSSSGARGSAGSSRRWRSGTCTRRSRIPALREKLRPRYAMGCKRILPTDEWYPALVEPNVEVVTDGIREVRANSIVGEDGVEREVDTIIFGTGFHVTDIPIAGPHPRRDGRTLSETWAGLAVRLQGLGRRRLPEPVLPRRAEHGPRAQLDRLHDRGADPVPDRRAARPAPQRGANDRGAPATPRPPTTPRSTA